MRPFALGLLASLLGACALILGDDFEIADTGSSSASTSGAGASTGPSAGG